MPVPSHPLEPIRLLALDLDRTLLRKDSTIGPRTLHALRAAHARGVEIVLASGRMTPAMEGTARQIGLDVHLIAYNGAVICGPAAAGRERLLHQPLDAGIARELCLFARQNRIQANFYFEDLIYVEDAPDLRPWFELYRSRTGSPFRSVPSLEDYVHLSPTKLLYVVTPEERERLVERLRPAFGQRTSMLRSDPEYLEFLNPNAGKGMALTILAQKLKVKLSQIMALGDGENDISMLVTAGWGVAVANASPACLAAAKAVTEADHEHDAVAEAIERFVV